LVDEQSDGKFQIGAVYRERFGFVVDYLEVHELFKVILFMHNVVHLLSIKVLLFIRVLLFIKGLLFIKDLLFIKGLLFIKVLLFIVL